MNWLTLPGVGILSNVADPFTAWTALKEIGSNLSCALPFRSSNSLVWKFRERIKECNLFKYGEGDKRQDL
jgi:hypothetical protein